jgi:hypothetical protein
MQSAQDIPAPDFLRLCVNFHPIVKIFMLVHCLKEDGHANSECLFQANPKQSNF